MATRFRPNSISFRQCRPEVENFSAVDMSDRCVHRNMFDSPISVGVCPRRDRMPGEVRRPPLAGNSGIMPPRETPLLPHPQRHARRDTLLLLPGLRVVNAMPVALEAPHHLRGPARVRRNGGRARPEAAGAPELRPSGAPARRARAAHKRRAREVLEQHPIHARRHMCGAGPGRCQQKIGGGHHPRVPMVLGRARGHLHGCAPREPAVRRPAERWSRCRAAGCALEPVSSSRRHSPAKLPACGINTGG